MISPLLAQVTPCPPPLPFLGWLILPGVAAPEAALSKITALRYKQSLHGLQQCYTQFPLRGEEGGTVSSFSLTPKLDLVPS